MTRTLMAVGVAMVVGALGVAAGCDQPSSPAPNASVNTKTEVKRDANGNVVEKKETTEVKPNNPNSTDGKTAEDHAKDAGENMKEGLKDTGKAIGQGMKDAGDKLKDESSK